MALKILVSGSAGAGKSSIIEKVVEKLGYEHLDIGQVFRTRAVAKGLTIGEYDKHIEQNPEEDREIDNEFKTTIQNSKNDCIASRRVGFHFLPNAINIRLDVAPEEGARRIFLQDRGNQEKKYKTIQEAMDASQDRMKRLQKRMLNVYGVDFMDKKNYNIILKTDGKTVEQSAEDLIKIIQDYKKKK